MRAQRLPDGTLIEATVSDTHTGPGRQGQRLGSGIWYRANGGEWVLSSHRHMHKIMEWVALSENLADFLSGEEQDA